MIGERVLFAWELGGNLGHVVPMLALAKALRERGHRCVFAMRDLSNALLVAKAGFAFFPAPARAAAPTARRYPSYAAMLSGEAFPSANAALASALAWRSLFRALRPDLLVADHAPAALLAARGLSLRVVSLGVPFSCPIPGRSLPLFAKTKDAEPEAALLRRLNAALAALSAPKLDGAAELYRVDATMVRGLPETDCFGPRADEEYVGGVPVDAGEARPAWPETGGPRVLVYLRKGPWLEPAFDALAARGASAVAHVPGLDQRAVARLGRPGLHVSSALCKFTELTRESDLVVCHGSQNTAATALLAGKPLVMVPTQVEQLLTSERIVAAGAGTIPPKLDADGLGKAFDAVAPGSPARAAAGRIAGRHAARADRSGEVVRRIESLLSGRL